MHAEFKETAPKAASDEGKTDAGSEDAAEGGGGGSDDASNGKRHPEPRWPASIAALAVGVVYTTVPEHFSIGSRWLPLTLIVLLVVPITIAHKRGYPNLNRMLGHIAEGIMTLFMLISLGLLIRSLMDHSADPPALLRSAFALWCTNILVFSLWYWRLDAGGPYERERAAGHSCGAFLFPQMTLKGWLAKEPDGKPWAPRFIDYLFLAFNTSTAFSPTDVPVLSRWAKALVMVQALISLATIVIVMGRLVNIL